MDLVNFRELRDNLDMVRKGFSMPDSLDDEDSSLRSVSQAENILDILEDVQIDLMNFFNQYSSLIGLFNKDFGNFKQFISRDSIIELCFLEDYLFAENETYPIVNGDELDIELLKSYTLTMREWTQNKEKDHLETTKWIDGSLELERNLGSLPCNCVDCITNYRSKFRGKIFNLCLEKINETREHLYDELDNLDVGIVSSRIVDLQQYIDKKINITKNKLKKASIHRLEKQLKTLMKERFDFQSDLGQKYVLKLKDFFLDILVNEGYDRELITDAEFDRFYQQLGINIWRKEFFLEKEFKKFLSSILFLKRKDISSQILQDYLGQFWLHSESRKINRKIIYHMGPTNSGKTYHAVQALSEAKTGCYLAPLRLLAGELYDTLTEKDVRTTLLTGEEVIEVDGATHYSSTIEMARFQEHFDCVVIDEIQMIGDSQRGWAWTRALVNISSPEIHVCGDASVFSLVEQICKLTGDQLEVKKYSRMTELKVEREPITLADLEKSDALIVFSRRNALKYKNDLEQLGFKVSIVYGRLSPEVRREQARKFDEGESDIIVSTDAISMGMNLPIKRIVFSTLTKYFDDKEQRITDSEIKQIAGRAGRYKRYPIGYATCLQRVENGIEEVEAALSCDLDQRKYAMVGPDLDIITSVNNALREQNLKEFRLSEFLRLFNTMIFESPFYCVDLKEMIEVAEMVEEVDRDQLLTMNELFGFACAPVNLGLVRHVQYFIWILKGYVTKNPIRNEFVDSYSDDIDYLETSIKCVELFQWLSRHFNQKGFEYEEDELLSNKSKAIERLNGLLSEKIVRYCSSCGVKLGDANNFNICETCFKKRRFVNKGKGRSSRFENKKKSSSSTGGSEHQRKKKKTGTSTRRRPRKKNVKR